MRTSETAMEITAKKETRYKDGIEYKYEMTVKESGLVASYKLPLYSISVTMESADGEIKSAKKSDIFVSERRAFEFFDKIVENLATPIDLPYVIEDEFSNY